jgi:hypothetical protein
MKPGRPRPHPTYMRSVIAIVLLASLASASVPRTSPKPPLREPRDPFAKLQSRGGKRGAWYMSQEGHAIFCYGPTMFVNGPDGTVQRVATFCRGEREIVPLHD